MTRFLKFYLSLFACLMQYCIFAQNTISATYTNGDIPTTIFTYDESCNGPATSLIITMPPGESYEVTGAHVSYTMTATTPGFIIDQRSKIGCYNTGLVSPEVSGNASSPGTLLYSYPINIANGIYAGGEQIEFNLYAMRNYNDGHPPCSTTTNKINSSSLTITLTYSDEIISPKVGVNTSSPDQTMQVEGKIKIGNDALMPSPGTIRYNSSNNDFEGYDGTEWVSFTKSTKPSWGQNNVQENESFNALPDNYTSEKLGSSVSVDDGVAVVGIPGETTTAAIRAGKVQPLKNENGHWQKLPLIQAPDAQDGAKFGEAVSLFYNTMAVGSPLYDSGPYEDNGRVYVFENTPGGWVYLQTITPPDPGNFDNFGQKVDVYEEYLAISAPNKTVGSNAGQGKVYVYKKTGGSYSLITSLTEFSGAGVNDNFGFDIDLDLNKLIVGIPFSDSHGSNAGKVYTYNRLMNDFVWDQEVEDPSPAVNGGFGVSVCIANTQSLFVSAPYKANGGVLNVGRVHEYRSISNSHVSYEDYLPVIRSENQYYGYELSGTYGYVLMSYNKSFGSRVNTGAVDLYKKEGDAWVHQTMLSASDGNAFDGFGHSTSVYANDILIGAPFKDGEVHPEAGWVYIFNKNY